jgi:hypothetical protein
LNVENIRGAVSRRTSAKIGVVLKGQADQVGDRVLCRLAEGFRVFFFGFLVFWSSGLPSLDNGLAIAEGARKNVKRKKKPFVKPVMREGSVAFSCGHLIRILVFTQLISVLSGHCSIARTLTSSGMRTCGLKLSSSVCDPWQTIEVRL